jgi:glucose/arabinose dehydrogenase
MRDRRGKSSSRQPRMRLANAVVRDTTFTGPVRMLIRAVLLLSLLGCRRDRDDHAVSHVQTPLGGGSAVAAPKIAPPDPVGPPPGPPPGDDKLVKVPADVAAHVMLREVTRGLARPVALVAAPGDPRKRLFVVEQHAGRIRILENGKLLARPFLTVTEDLSRGEEEGLLGLAFHPKFQTNGKLYVNYTAANMNTHIVEYAVGSDPDVVDKSTRRELVEIKQPYSNHNGGNLIFGPDGKLYTGMGDGGSAGDPKKNGQNKTALLAKILRFDVDAAAPTPEIVHLGVRNPWRFSFDAATNGLYIGDVGQNLWEYVWVAPIDSPTRNFGWNVVEGSHCYNAQTCDRTGFTPPAAEYSHDEGCSITGGFVYRGSALPALVGRYFYADYCTGLLRSFKWTADPSSPTARGFVREHWDWKPSIDPGGVLSQISTFGVDHDGELYLVKLSGVIYQLAPK